MSLCYLIYVKLEDLVSNNMEVLVKEWGGTAKLLKIEKRVFLSKIIVKEVPHVLRVKDGELELPEEVSAEDIEAVYVFPREVGLSVVVDEFGRKDARYSANLAESFARVEWSINSIVLLISFALAIIQTNILMYLFREKFGITGAVAVSLLFAVPVVCVLLILLSRLLTKSYETTLWEYRGRIARQFIRLANLSGVKVDLSELDKLELPAFGIILWKKYYPYVSEHIFVK